MPDAPVTANPEASEPSTPSEPSAPQHPSDVEPSSPRLRSALQALRAARDTGGEPAYQPASDGGPEADVAPPPEGEPAPQAPEAREERHARRLAEIARRDREVKQREASLKEQSELVEWAKGLKSKLQSDPLAAVESLGVTYEQLTQHYFERPTVDPAVAEVKSELSEVKNQLKAEREAAQKAQVDAIYERYRKECHDRVEAAGDEFELIKLTKAHDEVYQYILRDLMVAQAHVPLNERKVMDFEVAARDVEAELEAQYRPIATKARKFAVTAVPNDRPRREAPRRQTGGERAGDAGAGARDVTLTNSSVAAANPTPKARWSSADRVASAVEAMRKARTQGG